MIIPIRCFTCGKVLADKWKAYIEQCQQQDADVASTSTGTGTGTGKSSGDVPLHHNFDPVTRGKIMDSLGITRICCRRHMLGHVDLIDSI